MRRLSPARLARGVVRRLARPTTMRIVRAPSDGSESSNPPGYSFVRLGTHASAADRARAEDAMRTAGEAAGLVDPRLAHGDELFGWESNGQIVSFGWITYRNRSVGPVAMTDAPGRVFVYNAFTAQTHRGRGLFTALLIGVRAALAREGAIELMADVSVGNIPSSRALEKAGFEPLGQVTFVTFLNRWQWPVGRTVTWNPSGPVF